MQMITDSAAIPELQPTMMLLSDEKKMVEARVESLRKAYAVFQHLCGRQGKINGAHDGLQLHVFQPDGK